MKKRSRAMAVAALVLCISFAELYRLRKICWRSILLMDIRQVLSWQVSRDGLRVQEAAVTNWMVEDDLLRSHPDATGGQFIYLEFPVQQGIVTATGNGSMRVMGR